MKRELPARVTICQSILHRPNMETALVSVAEMGVTEVIPVYTARVRKLPWTEQNEEAQKEYDRWAKRLVRNSLREVAPTVHTPMDFADALMLIPNYDVAILAYENQHDPMCTARALAACKDAGSVLVFMGPERGFEPYEVEMAENAGARIVSLGNRIIRAANAGAILMGMIVYTLELNG